MKLRSVFCFISLALATALTIISCQKDSDQTRLQIHLTDEPADFEEVNVDLKQVNIKFDDSESNWKTVETKAGIYNLLDLQNGIDTLIADGMIPSGTVKEIRLVLGSENTLKVSGVTYPLVIPSGSESGLKIKLNKQVRGAIDSVIIDFNAFLSVKEEQDGFKLRPVLQIK